MGENNSTKSKFIYTEEELQNISELCEVLQGIRKRLLSEGISIEDVRKKIDMEIKSGKVRVYCLPTMKKSIRIVICFMPEKVLMILRIKRTLWHIK